MFLFVFSKHFSPHYLYAMKPTFSIQSSATVLSSQLGDISIASDAEYINVSVADASGNTILDERYYTFRNVATVRNLAEPIEAAMRLNRNFLSQFTITATAIYDDTTESSSVTIYIIYCDRYTLCSDVDTFLAENFLTTLRARRIPPETDTYLTLIFAANESSFDIKIDYLYRLLTDETIRLGTILQSNLPATEHGFIDIPVRYSDIIADIQNGITDPDTIPELLSFTVSCGQRSVTFYIDRNLSDVREFGFYNCFNIPEPIFFRSVTTAKTSVERSIATVNGVSSFYDQQASKTYETEITGLTAAEAEWIDQLLTSHTVLVAIDNSCDADNPTLYAAILITDMTCEMQDGDEKPNSLKFTWRYANDLPPVHLSASPSTFTSPYNTVFS
jgi:hypothetical protein